MNQLDAIKFVVANLGDDMRYDSDFLSLIADIAQKNPEVTYTEDQFKKKVKKILKGDGT